MKGVVWEPIIDILRSGLRQEIAKIFVLFS